MIIGQKKSKKPTNRELVGMVAALAMQVERLQLHVMNGDKALDEYMKMKGDKEDFVKYLEENYKDDKDSKKAEGK